MAQSILTPVLVLIAWTFVVWAWMYATRIPAVKAAKIDPQNAQHPEALNILPSHVRRVADNFNHLHEQPTVFYALAFYTHLAGIVDDLNVSLAWSYVALRVVHSLIQCTVNVVTLRWAVFSLSTIVLIVWTSRNLLAAF